MGYAVATHLDDDPYFSLAGKQHLEPIPEVPDNTNIRSVERVFNGNLGHPTAVDFGDDMQVILQIIGVHHSLHAEGVFSQQDRKSL